MNQKSYEFYWGALRPRMLTNMLALHKLLQTILPGYTVTPPRARENRDGGSVGFTVRLLGRTEAILCLDYKLLVSDMASRAPCVAIELAITDLTGQALGGHYPEKDTAEAFTTDVAAMRVRVDSLPIQAMAGYAAGCLGNPLLVAELDTLQG